MKMFFSWFLLHRFFPLGYIHVQYSEEVAQRCSVEKVFLEISQNSQENTCGLRPATLLKKKTLAQVFSCKFCEISKNTFSYGTPLVAASEYFFDTVSNQTSEKKVKS